MKKWPFHFLKNWKQMWNNFYIFLTYQFGDCRPQLSNQLSKEIIGKASRAELMKIAFSWTLKNCLDIVDINYGIKTWKANKFLGNRTSRKWATSEGKRIRIKVNWTRAIFACWSSFSVAKNGHCTASKIGEQRWIKRKHIVGIGDGTSLPAVVICAFVRCPFAHPFFETEKAFGTRRAAANWEVSSNCGKRFVAYRKRKIEISGNNGHTEFVQQKNASHNYSPTFCCSWSIILFLFNLILQRKLKNISAVALFIVAENYFFALSAENLADIAVQ